MERRYILKMALSLHFVLYTYTHTHCHLNVDHIIAIGKHHCMPLCNIHLYDSYANLSCPNQLTAKTRQDSSWINISVWQTISPYLKFLNRCYTITNKYEQNTNWWMANLIGNMNETKERKWPYNCNVDVEEEMIIENNRKWFRFEVSTDFISLVLAMLMMLMRQSVMLVSYLLVSFSNLLLSFWFQVSGYCFLNDGALTLILS